MSGTVNHGGITILAPQYAGSVDYYAALLCSDLVVVDSEMRYDKRFKSVHRTVIAGNRGALTLTVPVSHGSPEGRGLRWDDVVVSGHGQWWNVHVGALESAYGRTPYFEYYIEHFLPLLSEKSVGMKITDFDAAFDARIRALLGIETRVSAAMPLNVPEGTEIRDYRRGVPDYGIRYGQLREKQLGFIPGLSVLDMLFNVGKMVRMSMCELPSVNIQGY